jgi:hypothetical protein
MKPKNKIAMTLLLGLAMAAACYLAYARPVTKTSDDEADKLNQGIALFKAGRVVEAHTVLTNLARRQRVAWSGQGLPCAVPLCAGRPQKVSRLREITGRAGGGLAGGRAGGFGLQAD